MRVNKINKINAIKYHNVIVYGRKKDEIEVFLKTLINCDSIPVNILDNDSLTINSRNEIAKIYEKLQKNKCRTWEEYNRKYPEDKISLTIVSIYGTAKEIAKLPHIQECLAKAWAAGYRFILGIIDGNDKKILSTVNAHCECHIELSQK